MYETISIAINILTDGTENAVIFDSTYGKKSKAFGSGKIKVLEVINLSFKLNFNREIVYFSPNVLNTLMVFFFK